MTPEQERLLHQVAGTVARIDERTETFGRWSESHEKADAALRADIASLLETRTQATAAVGTTKILGRILLGVGVAVSSVIGWLVAMASEK